RSERGVAMRAVDAVVETVAPDGSTRAISIDELYRPPGDTPHIETVLTPGELIVSVLLPPPPAGRQVYRKVRDRASYAFALVSVAAILDVDGDRVRAARVAFGGLSYKPWRATAAEAALVGALATPAAFGAARHSSPPNPRRYCCAPKRWRLWQQRFQDPACPPAATRHAHASGWPQLRRFPMAQSNLAGPIGRPLDRVDGPLKVTGTAKYAFEYAAQGEAAYG